MTDLGNNLIAVSVPEEAENFDYERDNIFYDLPNGILERSINIGGSILDNYEILGTVTALDIDFDVEPCVEGYVLDSYTTYTKAYTNYYDNKKGCWYAEESFRSLLSAKGLFFENPHGKNKPKIGLDKFLEWETAEQNLVQKLIILKRL